MKRFSNWPELLAEFIEERRNVPFAWGKNDCGIFLFDWIAVATGLDLAQVDRHYTTAKGARTVVERHGGMKQLALNLGLAEKPVGMAQRGDGVLSVLEDRATFGVVVGNAMWCGPGERGLTFRPIDDVMAAFEV